MGFEYHLYGTHVRFGTGCAATLAAELDALGCSRPVVLMQKRMADSLQWAALREKLASVEMRVYGDVPTHGGVAWAESVAQDLRSSACDSIVAIGGGSVSDSAKALAMLMAEGGPLAGHTTRFTPPSTIEIPRRVRPKLPIVSLPTTASGAEVTPSFGARDGDHKLLFWNRGLSSTTVLIDPQLSGGVPMDLLCCTAMNGLAHCLEGLYSSRRSVLSDGIALQACKLFAEALESDPLDTQEVRGQLLLAGHLSGVVLSMTGTCLHHAICHVIGGRHAVGHGVANTIILPHALRFNDDAVDLSAALDIVNHASGARHASVADWVSGLVRRIGLPSSLGEVGIRAEDLPAIAKDTLKERGLALNPRRVSDPREVLSILEQAL